MDLQEARQLFDQYDGSRFYMSRDGVETAYLEAGIPSELEGDWLEELKRDKLRHLSQKGNWRVPHFLLHHSDLGYLADIIQAEPKGVLWERCAFLEELLKYASKVKQCERDHALVALAVDKVSFEADRLIKRARSDKSIARIRALLLLARQLFQETSRQKLGG